MTERKAYWLSLAALLVALPATIAFRSYDSALAWYQQQELDPILAETGKAVAYGGAEWRLEGIYQLRQKDDDAAIILAEFEARITDPASFAAGACQIRLSDRGDKRWTPLFLMPAEIRKARASVSDRSTCGGATIKPLKAGDMVKMAEAFSAPAELSKFDLTISQATMRPAFLILR